MSGHWSMPWPTIPSGVQFTITVWLSIISAVMSLYEMILSPRNPLSLALRDTGCVSRPNCSRAYTMAFDAPPVPSTRAFLCLAPSNGAMERENPITSLLYPHSCVLPLVSRVTFTTLTAFIALASSLMPARCCMTFSLCGIVTLKPQSSGCCSIIAGSSSVLSISNGM